VLSSTAKATRWPEKGLRGIGALGGEGYAIPIGYHFLSGEQVVLTPHNADQTPEGMELLNAGVVDNVIAFLEGKSQNRVV